MTLDELITEGQSVLVSKYSTRIGNYVPFEQYDRWKRKALMYLQQFYPSHPQVEAFDHCVSRDNSASYCQHCLSILEAFRAIQPKNVIVDYENSLERIFNSFYRAAKQLQRRHDGRPTIEINDEYDVQDLLHSLLLLYFEDVRAEEWTPSYAGGSKRMDFLLKESEIAIEVKMTRKGLKDKEIGEQLIVDIANYKQHKSCKSLYCFVYDPDANIRNPRGLEKDLQDLARDYSVRVFVRPNYY